MTATDVAEGMRVRYSRINGQAAAGRDYTVRVQAKPRGKWTVIGRVTAFGPVWAALGVNAEAWTAYKDTRAAAVADMLDGRTFLDETATSQESETQS